MAIGAGCFGSGGGALEAGPSPQPSVVLIVVDTLRADMVGALRPSGPGTDSPTPFLDHFAEGAAKFRRASTPAPFTMPAMAGLFTGAYPDRSGVVTHQAGISLNAWTGKTLAEQAREGGLLTSAIVSNPWLARPSTGFDRGFDQYDRLRGPSGSPSTNSAGTVTDRAIERIREADGRPFFLWVHYFDPHMAYEPPLAFAEAAGATTTNSRVMADFRAPGRDLRRLYQGLGYTPAEIEQARRLYEGEVRLADHEIGRLLEHLQASGLADNTLVIVAADHGESLGQHALFFAHDFTVYDELVHVPLLVRGPGVTPQTRDDRVSLLDVAPTVCRLADLPCAASIDGRDLFAPSSPRTLFAAGTPRRPKGTPFDGLTVAGPSGRWTMALADEHKLVRIPRATAPVLELYDLAADPTESNNLAATEPQRVAELNTQLDVWIREMNAARPRLPEQRLERRRANETLRSLGYLQ